MEARVGGREAVERGGEREALRREGGGGGGLVKNRLLKCFKH